MIRKDSPDSSDVHVPTIMGSKRRAGISTRDLRKKRMRMDAALVKAGISKGDYDGHPFRGNQWTRGRISTRAMTESAAVPKSKPKASPSKVPVGAHVMGVKSKKTDAQIQKETDSLSDKQWDAYRRAPKHMNHEDAMAFAKGKRVFVDADGDVVPLAKNGYPMKPISAKTLQRDPGGREGDGGRFSETGGDAVAAGMRRPTMAERKYGVADAEGNRYRIPPAWRDVWVSGNPAGNSKRLLVSGIDAKGKPQPVYTKRHRAAQDKGKFERVKDLSKELGRIDRQLEADVRAGSEEALAVALARHTGLRIGSTSRQLGQVQAFGITTLKQTHLTVTAKGVRLKFEAKRGKPMDVLITEPKYLVDALTRLKRERAGTQKPLFDRGAYSRTTAYRDRVVGDFKHHDFRTLKATTEAARLMKGMKKPRTAAELKRFRTEVGKKIGLIIGDTAAVALGSYINPVVFAQWEKGIASAV